MKKNYPLWHRYGASQVASAGNVREAGSTSGLGRSPGEGNGNLLQYSRLENPMERGAWQATDPGATKSQTGLSPAAYGIGGRRTQTCAGLSTCTWYFLGFVKLS